MVVDKNKDLVEAVYQALLIPVASRIYALAMGKREIELRAERKRRRMNLFSQTFHEWRKLKTGFV